MLSLSKQVYKINRRHYDRPISHLNQHGTIKPRKQQNFTDLQKATKTTTEKYKQGFNTMGEYNMRLMYDTALKEARKKVIAEKNQIQKNNVLAFIERNPDTKLNAEQMKILNLNSDNEYMNRYEKDHHQKKISQNLLEQKLEISTETAEEFVYKQALKKYRHKLHNDKINQSVSSETSDPENNLLSNVRRNDTNFDSKLVNFHPSTGPVEGGRHYEPRIVYDNAASKLSHFASTKNKRKFEGKYSHEEEQAHKTVFLKHDKTGHFFRSAMLTHSKPSASTIIINNLNDVLEIVRYGNFLKELYFTEKSSRNLIKYFPVEYLKLAKIKLIIVEEKFVAKYFKNVMHLGNGVASTEVGSPIVRAKSQNSKHLTNFENETFVLGIFRKNIQYFNKFKENIKLQDNKVFPRTHLIIDNL